MDKIDNQKMETPMSKERISILKFVNENTSALTMATVVLAPIISIFITLLLYSYYHGYYSYFMLSDIWIDLNNRSNNYNLIFTILISLAALVLNVIPTMLAKFKKKDSLFISIIVGVIIFFIIFAIFYIGFKMLHFKIIILSSIIVWVVLYGIGLFYVLLDCFCNMIIKKTNKFKERNNSNTNNQSKQNINYEKSKSIYYSLITATIALVIAIASVLMVVICYSTGKSFANAQTEFKLIESDHNYSVVLNESSEVFVISRADWNKETNQIIIYANEQTIIDKKDVDYKIIDFNDVDVKK